MHAASHGHAGSECFSSSSSTSSSTFLLTTHPHRPFASAVQQGAPDKRGLGFSSSPAVPQAHRVAAVAASERAWLNYTLEHPHIPASPAHRDGYRTGILLHSYAMFKKKLEELKIFFYSMAWIQAIQANAQRHTSIAIKRTQPCTHALADIKQCEYLPGSSSPFSSSLLGRDPGDSLQ